MTTASQDIAVEAFVPVAHGLELLGVRLSTLSRILTNQYRQCRILCQTVILVTMACYQ